MKSNKHSNQNDLASIQENLITMVCHDVRVTDIRTLIYIIFVELWH